MESNQTSLTQDNNEESYIGNVEDENEIYEITVKKSLEIIEFLVVSNDKNIVFRNKFSFEDFKKSKCFYLFENSSDIFISIIDSIKAKCITISDAEENSICINFEEIFKNIKIKSSFNLFAEKQDLNDIVTILRKNLRSLLNENRQKNLKINLLENSIEEHENSIKRIASENNDFKQSIMKLKDSICNLEEKIETFNKELIVLKDKEINNQNNNRKVISFEYTNNPFDKKGIIYFLGSNRFQSDFVNPYESNKINIIAESGFYNLTKGSSDGRKTLIDILDYYGKSLELKRTCATTTALSKRFFKFDFKNKKIFPNIICSSNQFGSLSTYLPNDLEFSFSIDNKNWIIFNSKIKENPSDFIKIYSVDYQNDNKYEGFSYLKIENKISQLLLSGLEIYGEFIDN